MNIKVTSQDSAKGGKESFLYVIMSYISILMLILIGSSLPFNLYHQRGWLLVFILFAIILRLRRGKIKWDSSLLYVVGLTTLMIITSIYNNSFDSNFPLFLLYSIVSYILLGSYKISDFKTKYLDVVCIMSLLSICIFLISLNYKLPLLVVKGDFVSIGYYMYHTIEWNGIPIERNAGVFTEPGCYQYCLCYTLILHLEDVVERKVEKSTFIKLLIVLLALITCASTTGYLVLIVLLAYVFLKQRRGFFVIFFISIPLLLGSLYFILNSDAIKDKFSKDSKTGSFVMRTADALAMVEMIKDHPLVGNGGVGTKIYRKRVLGYGALTADHGASNGVLVGMAVLGVSWLFLYILFCYRGCKRIFKNVSPLIIVLITLLIHSNEYFIFYPLIYIFIFPYRDSFFKTKKFKFRMLRRYRNLLLSIRQVELAKVETKKIYVEANVNVRSRFD